MAVKTSSRIGAKLIVCDTVRGRSVRNMSSYRGIKLIMAQCYSSRSMRELALSYGVYASLQEKHNSADRFISIALDDLTNHHDLDDKDVIVVIAGNFSGGNGSSYIEIGSVEYLRARGNDSD
jgi:pyruvate kinase